MSLKISLIAACHAWIYFNVKLHPHKFVNLTLIFGRQFKCRQLTQTQPSKLFSMRRLGYILMFRSLMQ